MGGLSSDDQRGIGLSDKPEDGYDTGTLAADLAALMGALGHQRFAVVGHDTGFAIGYALAADHPDRVARLALAEIPGPPGTSPPPPLFVPAALNDRLWHIPFNRVEGLPELLIAGREAAYFGYEFTIQGGKLADDVVDYYVSLLTTPDALRGSLGFYRAFDATMAQNGQRKEQPLPMPVLPSEARPATAGTSARRCSSSRPTSRAWSSPVPDTGSPRRHPRR